MSELDALLEDDSSTGFSTSRGVDTLPSDWEFAERILRRLKPRDPQHVYEMAAHNSKKGGMLITLMIVVYWLFIGMRDDDLSAGTSVFFGLDFGQAALAVMALSLTSAILSELSRDMGKIIPSSIAGGMLILAGLYVAEPLISVLFLNDFGISIQAGLWRTIRLGALWGGMTLGSDLLVNAMLLNWLIRFLDSNEVDFSGFGEKSSEHGRDEASNS